MLQELLRFEAKDLKSLVTCDKAAFNTESLICYIFTALVANALCFELISILFFV